MLAGQEAVDVDGTAGQDDHQLPFSKKARKPWAERHDEAKDVAEHEVSDAEVDREHHILLDGTGGSVEGNVSVVHSKGISPEGGEGDVVVRPCIEACSGKRRPFARCRPRQSQSLQRTRSPKSCTKRPSI